MVRTVRFWWSFALQYIRKRFRIFGSSKSTSYKRSADRLPEREIRDFQKGGHPRPRPFGKTLKVHYPPVTSVLAFTAEQRRLTPELNCVRRGLTRCGQASQAHLIQVFATRIRSRTGWALAADTVPSHSAFFDVRARAFHANIRRFAPPARHI